MLKNFGAQGFLVEKTYTPNYFLSKKLLFGSLRIIKSKNILVEKKEYNMSIRNGGA